MGHADSSQDLSWLNRWSCWQKHCSERKQFHIQNKYLFGWGQITIPSMMEGVTATKWLTGPLGNNALLNACICLCCWQLGLSVLAAARSDFMRESPTSELLWSRLPLSYRWAWRPYPGVPMKRGWQLILSMWLVSPGSCPLPWMSSLQWVFTWNTNTLNFVSHPHTSPGFSVTNPPIVFSKISNKPVVTIYWSRKIYFSDHFTNYGRILGPQGLVLTQSQYLVIPPKSEYFTFSRIESPW